MGQRPEQIKIEEGKSWLEAIGHGCVALTLALMLVLGAIVGLSSHFLWSSPLWAELLLHSIAFAIFTFAFGIYFNNMIGVLLVAMLASVGIELAQICIANRTFSILDILANDFGALTAWLVSLYLRGYLTGSDHQAQS